MKISKLVYECSLYKRARKQIARIIEAHGEQIMGHYGHADILHGTLNVFARSKVFPSVFLSSNVSRFLRPNNPLISKRYFRDDRFAVYRVSRAQLSVLISMAGLMYTVNLE